MLNNEIKRYQTMNEIAEPGGIVILGGVNDKEIPLCELKQAFALKSKIYNRSVSGLSLDNAAYVYENCVADLNPDIIFLHVGEDDMECFGNHPSEFDRKYVEIISHIKSTQRKCKIVIVSLKNDEDADLSNEINKHLKYIAQSQRCEFADISAKRIWNPKETKNVMSFVSSMGFSRPVCERPIYDLVKIFFCYDNACLA